LNGNRTTIEKEIRGIPGPQDACGVSRIGHFIWPRRLGEWGFKKVHTESQRRSMRNLPVTKKEEKHLPMDALTVF
jgi:hypothetical protein